MEASTAQIQMIDNDDPIDDAVEAAQLISNGSSTTDETTAIEGATSSNGDDVYVESDEHLTRVQEELDKMNYSNESINNLELEFDESKREYQRTLQDANEQLAAMEAKLGVCVAKARPYHESRIHLQISKDKYLKAKHKFETAQELYVAAKRLQMFADDSLSISKTMSEVAQNRRMSEQARLKVIDAELAKQSSDLEQISAYAQYAQENSEHEKLVKSLRRTIERARDYFDLKEKLDKELTFLGTKTEALKNCLLEAKAIYQQSLNNLEMISTEIHTKRQNSANPNNNNNNTRPSSEIILETKNVIKDTTVEEEQSNTSRNSSISNTHENEEVDYDAYFILNKLEPVLISPKEDLFEPAPVNEPLREEPAKSEPTKTEPEQTSPVPFVWPSLYTVSDLPIIPIIDASNLELSNNNEIPVIAKTTEQDL